MRAGRLCVVVAGFALVVAGAANAAAPAPGGSEELAALLRVHEAFSDPSRASTPLGLVAAERPLTGERTVLPVLAEATGPAGAAWLRVRLPGRPNGRVGWIVRAGTVARTTSLHIVVDTSTRRLTVYRNGEPVRVVSVVVGKPATPTPLGEFFVEESIRLRPSDVGAPFALALSARSNVLQEFDGGPGQIALHGRAHIGGVLGSAVSHGCVRLDDGAIRWLVRHVGPGVPVTITR